MTKTLTTKFDKMSMAERAFLKESNLLDKKTVVIFGHPTFIQPRTNITS